MKGTSDALTHSISSSTSSIASEDSPDNGYAFLNHSQVSLGRHSPPEVDDQRLTRQRRRRTSPEDQAILEAEFSRDPKPDKATRLNIVNRVALGEKEVQIWFQNRRQLSRRKSRPADIQDLEETVARSQGDATTDCTLTSSFSVTDLPTGPSSQSSALCSQDSLAEAQSAGIFSFEKRRMRDDNDARIFESSSNPVTRPEGVCQIFKMDSGGTMRPRQPPDTFNSIAHKRRPGYLANRRSASFIIHEDKDGGSTQTSFSSSQDTEEVLDDTQLKESIPSLKRVASLVKLSMDADGKAEVTPRSGDTPSPPRSASLLGRNIGPRRFLGLQRSLSAAETRISGQGLKRSTSSLSQSVGRSKDARTWEFYCDGSAREELIKQAQRVECGSATAAIGLLRSQSNNHKPLKPNSNKRNAHVPGHDPVKRSKTDSESLKRSKLERTMSSVARLQTSSVDDPKRSTKKPTSKHRKSNSQSAIFEDFEGDSDKENWEPGTQRRPEARRRPVPSQEASRILLESLSESGRSSCVGNLIGRGSSQRRGAKSKALDKENTVPHIDDQVAAFMGGSDVAREEEDLNCVQNLLSLSQGPWV